MDDQHFGFTMRMIPECSAEQEWVYLLSETYRGELAIIPLLEELLNSENFPKHLNALIHQQIDEEVDHVKRYESLLGSSATCGSGYHIEFAHYYHNITNPILKLFALQAILEGQSLGAVGYRLSTIENSCSTETDKAVLRDELGHTRFGYAFFKTLVHQGATCSAEEFRTVSRDCNQIFASHFTGERIAQMMRTTFGVTATTETIDNSTAMKIFKKSAAKTLVETKNEFTKRYFGTVKNVAH